LSLAADSGPMTGDPEVEPVERWENQASKSASRKSAWHGRAVAELVTSNGVVVTDFVDRKRWATTQE
jgi:hypothetical protein